MIVATEALSAPKVRVGHIGGNFTLPRTVPLTSLIAAAIGALLGLAVSLIIVPGLTPMLFCAVFGGALGVAAVTLSPLKGESMSRWLGLQLKVRRQRIKLEGGVVQIAVGIALIKTATLGEVHIVPGALNVPPSQYDERGAPLESGDILRSILESAGVADIADTVMSGSSALEDVEYNAPPQAWRRRPRPQASAPEPPRPVARPFSPATSFATPVYSPIGADQLQDVAPLVPEVLPDLPDLEGISDWLPSVSLESLFDEPEPPPPPPQQNFTVIEKKQSVSEWASPETQAPTVPEGWTRPGQ